MNASAKSLIFPAPFATSEAAMTGILGGNSRVTLVSKTTGARYTYRITLAKSSDQEAPRWWVSLLTGQNNEEDYTYIGVIRKQPQAGVAFSTTPKSGLPAQAAPVKAIAWTLQGLQALGQVPTNLEIWHEGRCCRCGRTLTVPESISSGFGPECIRKGPKR